MGQKNIFFEKQSGEVAENKGSDLKNKPEQTGKQSGEVVDNTCLWKKLTGNKPANEPGYAAENKDPRKNSLPHRRPLAVFKASRLDDVIVRLFGAACGVDPARLSR